MSTSLAEQSDAALLDLVASHRFWSEVAPVRAGRARCGGSGPELPAGLEWRRSRCLVRRKAHYHAEQGGLESALDFRDLDCFTHAREGTRIGLNVGNGGDGYAACQK
jgi:hypothetical protein